MARINLLSNAMRNAGTYTIPAQTIAAGITHVDVEVARDAWPDTGGDVIKADIEISPDGGVSWQYLMGFTAGGGVLTNKLGVEVPYTKVSIDVPNPELANRQLRATVQTFAKMRLACDVTVT